MSTVTTGALLLIIVACVAAWLVSAVAVGLLIGRAIKIRNRQAPEEGDRQ